MLVKGFGHWSSLDQEECLIVEELCRVMAGARRFQTIIEAWKAMQTTRRIAAEIRKETETYHGPEEVTSGASASSDDQ